MIALVPFRREAPSAPHASRFVALPLSLRNWVARLILDALVNPESRRALGELSRFCSESNAGVASRVEGASFPIEFFEERAGGLALRDDYARYHDELCDRVGRAVECLGERPFLGRRPSLARVLDEAAELFDARLYFEVHELLEPFWTRAVGKEREILQGLIQVAAGFHHLANGQVRGAVSLLDEGSLKLVGRTSGRMEVGTFGIEVRRALKNLEESPDEAERSFDWSILPRFPREG